MNPAPPVTNIRMLVRLLKMLTMLNCFPIFFKSPAFFPLTGVNLSRKMIMINY